MNQITIEGTTLTVKVQPPNQGLQLVLILMLFALVALTFATLYGIFNGGGFNFSYLITLVILGLVFFHLFRVWSWNKYGEEHFIIEDAQLVYSTNYKFFSSQISKIHRTEDLKATINNHEEKPNKVLVFNGKNEQLASSIKLDFEMVEDWFQVEKNINDWLDECAVNNGESEA